MRGIFSIVVVMPLTMILMIVNHSRFEFAVSTDVLEDEAQHEPTGGLTP